jgi:hypothetical protein
MIEARFSPKVIYDKTPRAIPAKVIVIKTILIYFIKVLGLSTSE